MTTTKTIPTPAQLKNDPVRFAETFLRILDKDKNLIPLRYNRMQRHSLAHETRRTLKVKMRQGTMSTMEQSKLFWLATTRTITSLTLANKDDTTQAMRRMADRFYEKIPEPFPRPMRTANNDRITTYGDTGSECIIATAGGVDIGHSLTISRAHLTEVSRWRNPDDVMQGVLQAIPVSGYVVAESTPAGQGGWFFETCMETLDSGGSVGKAGRNGWSIQFYPWWWAEDYALALEYPDEIVFTDEERELCRVHKIRLTPEQIKWRRQKIADEKGKFPESYPEDIHTCFLMENGTSVFRNVRSMANARGNWTYAEYIAAFPNARFIMGVDWGRDNDWSVFTVMDATTWTVVAVERYRHVDWPIQRAYLKTLADAWQCEKTIAERNSIGDPNISELRTAGLLVQPFNTTHLTKKQAIDNLTLAIEEADIHLLQENADVRSDIANIVIGELMSYAIKKLPGGDYGYEAPKGMHDDCVMSLALALYGCRQLGARRE